MATNKSRHITPLILFAFYAIFTIISSISFELSFYHAKKEARKKRKEDELVDFYMTRSGSEQLKGREFEYKGEMYDVYSRTEQNGLIQLRCYKDRKETSLKKSKKKWDDKLKVVFEFIKKITHTHVSVHAPEISITAIPGNYFSYRNLKITASCHDIFIPPPCFFNGIDPSTTHSYKYSS